MQILKHVRMAALLIAIPAISFAENRQPVNIEHATIFLSGAELNSTAKVILQQGETEILFTNIAGNVNQQSLSVGADNNVVVQSATFQNNYLVSDNLSPKARQLKDSIETVEGMRSTSNNQLQTVTEQISILSQNRQVSGANTGLSVAELQKMLDLVKTRMAGLLNEKDKLAAGIKKTDEKLALLKMQLDEEQRKAFQPGGQLLVKFYSTKATASNISISYVVPNAGWSPSYDLRVDNLKDPVKLFYKANVYQSSGVKWDKVNVTLSTGNPSEGAQSPALNPWYLSFYNPITYDRGYLNQSNSSQRMQIAGAKAKMYAADGIQAEEVMAPAPATMNDHVQVDNSGINTSFDIDLPYNIPSDGQNHMVAIKTYDLPASYAYYSVPKLDRDAFLQARITNWEDLNLLPAPTNIFYEGSYVGQGYIDMRNVKDTMNLSLGRDKKIVIRRERDKELKSIKTIGSNVRESFVYTISMRNTRKEAVTITVVDQVPVSNDKDIVIEDIDLNGGVYDETTGQVKWELQLKPNETRSLKLGYTVKYPKGKSLNL